jgi:hypothetical protein
MATINLAEVLPEGPIPDGTIIYNPTAYPVNTSIWGFEVNKILRNLNNRIATMEVGVTPGLISIPIDGSGSQILTGQRGYVRIPFAGVIADWSIISKEVGSITIDVLKKAGSKPSTTDSMCGSAKPALVNSDTIISTTMTGWNKVILVNDFISWNIISVTAITWAILQFTVNKTLTPSTP